MLYYMFLAHSPICRVGRTVAVDEWSEVSFSIPEGTLPWQLILWVKSTSSRHIWLEFTCHLQDLGVRREVQLQTYQQKCFINRFVSATAAHCCGTNKRIAWFDGCRHTHQLTTHTRLTALCPGLPGWASTRKVKPIWILLKQETASSSGISWAICKSAPSSTDNHPCQHPTTQLSEAGCPSCHPTNSIKALKANQLTDQLTIINRQEGDNRVGYVRLCLASSLF